MDIKRNGSRPSGKGPAEYFTGAVRVDPLLQATDPSPEITDGFNTPSVTAVVNLSTISLVPQPTVLSGITQAGALKRVRA